MKTYLYSHLFILFFLLIVNACAIEPTPELINNNSDLFLVSNLNNRVSFKEAYAQASIVTKTKSESDILCIEPIVSIVGDTLMFIVNYYEGWKILSADKRTPLIIASGDSGNISLSSDNLGFLAWLDMTATDMMRIINSDDRALNFTPEQIETHRKEWEKITREEDFSQEKGEIVSPMPKNDPGLWELVGTSTEEVYYDEEEHLIEAQWDQTDPYNYYCPPKTNGTGNKPVGCTPVAGGQMLQYLYSQYGFPTSFSFGGNTGYMSDLSLAYNSNPGLYDTALFLRSIGFQLGASYGNNGTSVLFPMDKLKTLFESLGYTCTKQSYSADKVKQNLFNNMPVLVSGYSGTILGLPNYSNGHTYIIDGYKLFRTKYTYYYERIYGDPPRYEHKQEVVFSSPYIGAIKMNWGWWTQWESPYTNNGWYALTGDWIVIVNGNNESFTNGVTILCDFAFDPFNT